MSSLFDQRVGKMPMKVGKDYRQWCYLTYHVTSLAHDMSL